MAMFLKDFQEVQEFHKAIQKCKGDVFLLKNDGTEEFNLKSALSEFIALSRLAEKYGDQYEVFCQNPADESILLQYYYNHSENK